MMGRKKSWNVGATVELILVAMSWATPPGFFYLEDVSLNVA
jgi:hypothetical protein